LPNQKIKPKNIPNFDISDTEVNDEMYTLNFMNQMHHTPTIEKAKPSDMGNYNYYPQNLTKRAKLNNSLAMPTNYEQPTFSTLHQQNPKYHKRDLSIPKAKDIG
jgi:hypothetical protein